MELHVPNKEAGGKKSYGGVWGWSILDRLMLFVSRMTSLLGGGTDVGSRSWG